MLAHTRILQLDVLGSFDFYTQIVSVDAVESTEFDQLMREVFSDHPGQPFSMEQFQRYERVLPLLAHELTHFVDCTATVWGLNHLSLLDNAFRAMRLGEEKNFHFLKALHDHIRTLRLPAYYTEQGPATNAARPWGYRVSLGRRFSAAGHINNNTSITFCRFMTAKGELLVRSPLSPVSLLETSAMAQELLLRNELLNRLKPEDRLIESGEFSRSTMQYLYRRDLTEYSVCAHLLANQQQLVDALSTFMLSSVVARWVLNAPPRAYARVSKHAPLGRLLGTTEKHPFVVALRDGIRSGDLGAMYYAMVTAMPPDAVQQLPTVHTAMENAMAALALEPSAVIDWRAEVLDKIDERLRRSPSQVIRSLAAAGIRNASQLPLFPIKLPFAQLDLPKVLFGDYEYRHTMGNAALSLADVDPERGFTELFELERYVAKFAEACV
jgi:hypothetical protein